MKHSLILLTLIFSISAFADKQRDIHYSLNLFNGTYEEQSFDLDLTGSAFGISLSNNTRWSGHLDYLMSSGDKIVSGQNVDLDINGFIISSQYTINLSGNHSVFGLLGYQFITREGSVGATQLGSDNMRDIVYGFGYQYNLSARNVIEISYKNLYDQEEASGNGDITVSGFFIGISSTL